MPIFTEPYTSEAIAILQNYPELKKRDFLEVSNSSFLLADSCFRKFEFRKVFGNARRETSEALSVGTALHVGIQTYTETHDKDYAIFCMLTAFNFSYQKSNMDNRSWQSCVQILSKVMQFWDENMDEWELAKIQDANGNEIPAVEVPFSIIYIDPKTGLKIKYIGYIDFILYNKIENKYYVVDYKTSTGLDDKTVEFKFASQCLPYGLVLEVLLNHPIEDGFDVMYWCTYLHMLDTSSQIYTFDKSYQDIQDWMIQFTEFANRFINFAKLGWFPRKSNGCIAYNRPCQFFSFCDLRRIKQIRNFIALDKMEQAEKEKEEILQSERERPKPWIEITLDSRGIVL